MGPEASPANGQLARAVPSGLGPGADERLLIAGVLEKDRKATAEFVARYADPVHNYVARRLAPRGDLTEDVVHEVFIVALQGLHGFAGQSSLLSWLLGIARHKVEDVYRARLREPEALDETDGPGPAVTATPDFEAAIDGARLRDKTQRVLAQLPEPYATALRWRYWEKRSTTEMAAGSGRTDKAMERLLARARAQFRRLWDAE